MAKRSNRRFFLFGKYSLALLLPKKWLNELGVEPGVAVALEYDTNRRKITLRFDDNNGDKPIATRKPRTSPAAAEEPADSNDDSWQPIAEL